MINIVHAHNLQETNFSKADFMAVIKPYLKKVVAKLKENGKDDRVAGFQQGATELIKFIVNRYDEMQIFAYKKYDMEAGLCVAWQKEQEDEGPTFLYFLDGLREEKF